MAVQRINHFVVIYLITSAELVNHIAVVTNTVKGSTRAKTAREAWGVSAGKARKSLRKLENFKFIPFKVCPSRSRCYGQLLRHVVVKFTKYSQLFDRSIKRVGVSNVCGREGILNRLIVGGVVVGVGVRSS